MPMVCEQESFVSRRSFVAALTGAAATPAGLAIAEAAGDTQLAALALRWRAHCEALEAASERGDAPHVDRLLDEAQALQLAVADTPATTLRGAQLKAEVACDCILGRGELDAEINFLRDTGGSVGGIIAFTLVRDLLQLVTEG